MGADRDRFKQYEKLKREVKEIDPRQEIELFGCELYQINSIIVQQLGFGTEFALGVTLASGRVNQEELQIPPEVVQWRSAQLWVTALRDQKNYPRDLEDRNMFREIAPPKVGTNERNRRLEELYTEIGRLKSGASKWTWHLPKPSYEETAKIYGLE